MKILISLVQMRPGYSGGIASYVTNLAYYLANNVPEIDIHLIETFFNHKYFCDIPDDKCTRHLLRKPYRYREETIELISNIKPDIVFYPAAGGDPLFESEAVKFVVCIADLQHLAYPGFFSKQAIFNRNKAFKETVDLAHHVITLSKHAKSSICSAYGLSDEEVSVVSPALDKSYFTEQAVISKNELIEKYAVPDDYIFYPANFWQHKNHANLFKALKILNDDGMNVNLVMTGDLFNENSELELLIKDLDINNHIFILGYLTIDEVSSLIKHAKILVFPSLFEGFGIPVLEAFANHTPLCCSNVTSLPEVAGEAAIFFDPHSPDEIAAALKKLYSDDDLCKRLVSAGDKQLENFNYDKSSQALYEVFQTLVESKKAEVSTDVHHVNPLVTIITPSYNQGEYIEDTIKSVLSQSYENIEYIVMDGGSDDGTVDILKKYSDKLKWISEPDNGQTDAINKGLKSSNGDYFCYLNSDDTLEKDAIKNMLLFLESHPEYTMVYGDADYIDKSGDVISAYQVFDWHFDTLKGHCFICQPATMWRKQTITDYGYFDDSLNYIMDYEYWLRIADKGGSIGYLPEKLASSRLYNETKTLSGRAEIFREIFEISDRMFGVASVQWHKAYADYLVFEKYNYLKIKKKTVFSQLLIAAILVIRKPSYFSNVVINKLKNMKALIRHKLIEFLNKYGILGALGSSQRPVSGVYADGWVSNCMVIDYAEKKVMKEVIIEGDSHENQTLTIEVDGDSVKKDIGIGGFSIRLPVFSGHVQDVAVISDIAANTSDREQAYILTYTNLFTDLDVAWKI